MTIDELAKQIEEKFAGVDQKFGALEKKVDQGFDDSKTRDEELRDLMKFGLEAREALRDEMHRRFDEAAGKHDQQITLLQDAVRHRAGHK
jgi:hypothetical protein